MNGARMALGSLGFEVSGTHARGLRRDLFCRIRERVAPQLQTLCIRARNARLPQPSMREARAIYLRTRQSLRACAEFFTEDRTPGHGTRSCAVLLAPGRIDHGDGIEPVLAVVVVLLVAKEGRIALETQRCGRISHHAIERMYQRLRTSSHEAVMTEVRSALRLTAALQGAAFLSRRSVAIHQLPVPTAHGVLRCIRDPDRHELEVRTFTLRRPGDRADLSVSTIRAWAERGELGDSAGFAALLRDPANRWWRDRYGSREWTTRNPGAALARPGAAADRLRGTP
jgi:hypothetical protein